MAGQAAVTVTLGGKERTFRFDTNALAELEGALGKTTRQLLADMKRGLTGTRQIRALVWACLLHAEPHLTLGDVGRMLDTADVAHVAGLAMQAVAQHVGDTPSTAPGGGASVTARGRRRP